MHFALPPRFLPTDSRRQSRAVRRPVGRIDQDGHAVGEIEAAADDQSDAGHLGGFMGAHDAGETVAVGDGERFDPEQRAACANSSSQDDAPRRNEKCDVTWSSA